VPPKLSRTVGSGGRLVALDLFDSTEILQRQWPRLTKAVHGQTDAKVG
jgi:hypothetical protein